MTAKEVGFVDMGNAILSGLGVPEILEPLLPSVNLIFNVNIPSCSDICRVLYCNAVMVEVQQIENRTASDFS